MSEIPMETVAARVLIFRRRDGEGEVVGEFRFSDMAQLAAASICERFKWSTEVRFTDESFKPIQYNWGQKTVDGVVRK